MKFKVAALSILAGVASLSYGDAGRTSSSYQLVHESTGGSHGGRITSASYTLDTNGASAGGVSESTTGLYTHRDGFAGQLLDLSAVQISGMSAMVETSTRSYTATGVYDDGSEGAVEVVWAVSSPPGLLSVTPAGVVTAAAIYQTQSVFLTASAQGVTGSRTITVVNFFPDNFGSYAGDGLPDLWQVTHFQLDSPDADPDADPDRDGRNNLLEYLSGYSPLDSSQFLCATLAATDTLVLSQVIPDRRYLLFRSTNLRDWEPAGSVFIPVAQESDRSFVDPAPLVGEPKVFYRVGIQEN